MNKRFARRVCRLIFSRHGRLRSGRSVLGFGNREGLFDVDCTVEPIRDPGCRCRIRLLQHWTPKQPLRCRGRPIVVNEPGAESRRARGRQPPERGASSRRSAGHANSKTLSLTQSVVALPIYGQKLFLNPPTTFAPVEQAPVPADYVIGPGDKLLIRVWGQVDIRENDAGRPRRPDLYPEGWSHFRRRRQIRQSGRSPEAGNRAGLQEFRAFGFARAATHD